VDAAAKAGLKTPSQVPLEGNHSRFNKPKQWPSVRQPAAGSVLSVRAIVAYRMGTDAAGSRRAMMPRSCRHIASQQKRKIDGSASRCWTLREVHKRPASLSRAYFYGNSRNEI
jgi:hypothetical protein